MVEFIKYNKAIHFPNFYDFTEMNAWLMDSNWEIATGSDDPRPYYRCELSKSYDSYIQIFLDKLQKYAYPVVRAHFGFSSIEIKPSFFTYNIFTEGAGIGPHQDVNSGGMNYSEFVTVVIYSGAWNSGGEFVIYEDGTHFKISVRPGSVVFVDSATTHEALPASGGQRISGVAHAKITNTRVVPS